ncbi:hypothetical protein M8J76_007187 [Diaphorina citri]|nr:hypothetical protein M8J76_007187 [Diaphorina citri]
MRGSPQGVESHPGFYAHLPLTLLKKGDEEEENEGEEEEEEEEDEEEDEKERRRNERSQITFHSNTRELRKRE